MPAVGSRSASRPVSRTPPVRRSRPGTSATTASSTGIVSIKDEAFGRELALTHAGTPQPPPSGTATVNVATEFPQLKIANARNPNPIPYMATAYDPLRRPFHRPTLHTRDGQLSTSSATTFASPPSSMQLGGTMASSPYSTTRTSTAHTTGTPTAQNNSRVRRRLEMATSSPMATPDARRRNDAEDEPEEPSRALTATSAAPSPPVRDASWSASRELALLEAADPSRIATLRLSSSRGRHLLATAPSPLYGDKHQAQCVYCQAAAFDAARKEVVQLMREERGVRRTVADSEADERGGIWRLFEPLHQRYLRTIARWVGRLNHARDAASIRLAIDETLRQEAVERAAVVREALRMQRALARCMVRSGAASIEAGEAAVRERLIRDREAAEARAKQRAADREALIAGLRERAKQHVAAEEKRRVQLRSEEFRAAARLLLLERERRERVAFEVHRRREAEAARQRLDVERDYDAGRVTVVSSELEARQELKATIAATQAELRANLHLRRRQDLQRREELGRRLKATALLQELATLMITRVCPAMELEARNHLRSEERAARASIVSARQETIEQAEHAFATDEQKAADAAHARAATELVGDLLFPWASRVKPSP